MIWNQLLDKPGKICTEMPQTCFRHTRFTWSYSQLVLVLTVCKAINLELAPLPHAKTTILDLSHGSNDVSRAPTWVFNHTQTLILDMVFDTPISGAAEDFKQLRLIVLETYVHRYSASDIRPETISDAIRVSSQGPIVTGFGSEEVVTLVRVHANRWASVSGCDLQVEDMVRSFLSSSVYNPADFLHRSYFSMLLTTRL